MDPYYYTLFRHPRGTELGSEAELGPTTLPLFWESTVEWSKVKVTGSEVISFRRH